MVLPKIFSTKAKYSFLSPTSRSSAEKSDHDASETDPFVHHDHEPSRDKKLRPWFRSRGHLLGIAVHVVLLALNLMLTVALVSGITYDPLGSQPSTPSTLRNIGYQLQKFYFFSLLEFDGSLTPGVPHNFSGPPRPELAAAWDDLQKNSNIRVTDAELGPFLGQKNLVKLADGSGSYYATLAVFHGLHCVERMHHVLYKEHYYGNMTGEEEMLLRIHSEHCLDYLRQYVQCNADTTLIPMYWPSGSAKPTAFDGGQHQCAAWPRIESWMAERAFEPFTPGLLVHPTFGNPYVKDPSDRHLNLGVAAAPGEMHAGHGKVREKEKRAVDDSDAGLAGCDSC